MSELDRARLATKSYIERVAEQIAGLRQRQYPGECEGPEKWLNLVEGLVSSGMQCLSLSEQQSDLESKISIRDAGRFARRAYECLIFISGADISELPYPIVRPMEEWFRKLQLNNTLIFRAEDVANYELFPQYQEVFEAYNPVSESLLEAIDEITWPIIRVTVPGSALGILPHFGIVAHELGHAVYPRVPWNLTWNEREFRHRLEVRLNVENVSTKIMNRASLVLAKWIQEIAADAFGTLIAGPAFFFAFSEFSQVLGKESGASASHPPNGLRRELSFNWLDNNSFTQILRENWSIELNQHFNSPSLIPPPSGDEPSNILSEESPDSDLEAIQWGLLRVFQTLGPEIYTQAEAFLRDLNSSMIYAAETFHTDLERHLEALKFGIPPIEYTEDMGDGTMRTKGTDFVSVLNVGWIALLTQLPELRLSVDPDDDDVLLGKRRKLHNLLLKAVELSEARQQWENA